MPSAANNIGFEVYENTTPENIHGVGIGAWQYSGWKIIFPLFIQPPAFFVPLLQAFDMRRKF